MTSLRNLLFASAIAAGALAATSASAATQVYLNNIGYYNTAKVTINGSYGGSNFTNVQDLAVGLKLDVNYGVGPALPKYTLWGFCVDLFHNIAAGGGYQAPVNLQYMETGGTLYDGKGNTVDAAKTSKILGLANLGYHLVQDAVPDLQNKLSGIQAAIWSIEYASLNFVANDAPVEAYRQGYIALAPSLSGTGAYGLYAVDFKSQGFVIGVPEPATWAMMIVGFGLVGVTLRSSRRRPVAA